MNTNDDSNNSESFTSDDDSDPFTADDFTYNNVQYYYTIISEENESLNRVMIRFENDDVYDKDFKSTIHFWLSVRELYAITAKLLARKKILGLTEKGVEKRLRQIYAASLRDTVSRGDTSTQT